MSAPSYRFGEFRVDPATRRLWKGEDGVALRPKVFDCIVYLIEHRDRAVGRDELISAVWGKVDITDGVLGQTILQARRSLDDTGKEQTTVRTVQGFGYHWVAKVDVVEPPMPTAVAIAVPVAATPVEASPLAPVAPPRRRRTLVAAIAAALVVAPLAAYVVWRERPTATAPATPTIAASQASALVLPVVVEGVGDSPAWIRLGAMDLVADRLHAAGLRVVPSDNVVMLAGRLGAAPGTTDIGAMLRATRATVAVEPRARRTAQGWRMSLTTPLGATPPISVHGEGTDVLDAARVAADELARALGYRPPAGGTGDGADLAMLLTQVDAAVLSGQLDQARQLLESAGAEALARPDLRFQLARIDYEGGRLDTAEAAFRQIAADVSPEADRTMRARALNGLGAVAFKRERYADAEQLFGDALGLLDREHPRERGIAYNGRAVSRNAQRRFDDAMADFAEARVALELAGDSIHLVLADSNLGALNFNRGRYADAAVSLARAAERFESFHVYNMELMTRVNLANVQTGLVDVAGAQANARRIEALIPLMNDPSDQNSGRLSLVHLLRERGALRTADEVLNLVRAAAQTDATAAAAVGAIDARQAFADGDPRRATELAAPVLKQHAEQLFPRFRTQTRYVLVGAYARNGDLAAAQRELDGLRKASDDDLVPPAPMYLALAQAEIARAAGTADAATSAYAEAVAAAEASHIPADVIEACAAYAGYLLERGELARASAVAERVSPWVQQNYAAALVQLALYHASGLAPAWRTALERARALAGERAIPPELTKEPVPRS
ncbi:winged helix-turn-helix domain-containing protein [Tahibacter soli]|uniref:Winged helix-turn-helix domain-containing protein n=1 Tax=Tahibacter soli TaxID=2983605 RepID=A0A9X3YQB4_9GAMM|nr:winged helix-turn-helix domain-containing protein [Tahibacter soli]MDC8015018.1 winged helix-turn-helix domain-containing protein [Tahibacter soli]